MRSSLLNLLFVAGLVCGPVIVSAAADAAPEAERQFVLYVLPALQEKCLACHGNDPEDLQGGFDMRTREGLLKGGESGDAAIVPGKGTESPLYRAVRWEDLEMPPKENDRLSDEQIAYIREWIDAGAPWPNAERIAQLQKEQWAGPADGVPVKTSGGLKPEWTNRRYDPANLWAYQPLWRDVDGRLSREQRNPIDVLIDEKLDSLGISPAPAADRRTLLRRVTFDLIGLPPTPEEIEAFASDPAPDDEAFAKVVERLLASPQYGEQWARHWLDVVRYADSSGYANDYERGNAWRYRDYVVRAFNDDKPYDEFIVEQIAGDELVDLGGRRSEPLTAPDSERLVAVGFLRMGPWELTGMEVPKIARQRFLDDVTDAVGQVFLAHMLQCARCHDHKFDPIPTRDYYSMQAAFATTQLVERRTPFLPRENLLWFEEQEYILARRQFYERVLDELEALNTLDAAREWYREQGRDASLFEAAVAELQAKSKDGGEVSFKLVRARMQKQGAAPDLIPPASVGFTPREFGLERIARKGLERLEWRLERYQPVALSVYSGLTPVRRSVLEPQRMPANRFEKGELEQTCILAGGDPFSPAAPVEPGVLSAPASLTPRASDLAAIEIPDAVSGRRLALARWIASEQNPLTARVMVNRIWQWHFGQPLAGNPNNFGATGKKPTHPELLDWLAGEFVRQGWSTKAIHRLILSSEAYRRGTQHPNSGLLAEKDPLGTSYAAFRPRRLDAEEIRDAMLSVSGELNPAIGGIPARPEMNLEAALQPRMVMGTFAEAWQPSPLPAQRHRRSLYALKLRGLRDPFQEVFNAPSPDLCTEAREASTVTPQVFALFNSEATFSRALALADRAWRESGQDRTRSLSRVFRLVFGREPTGAERAACESHWEAMERRHASLELPRAARPTEVVREAVEENTGEKFAFTEPLEAYADFVPDLQAADVGSEVRGLAEVCLVLLNSNEFVYVY